MSEPIRLDFEVAGCNYRREDFKMANLAMGQELSFQTDPDNPHDRTAIKVMKGDIQIGFVPALLTVQVGEFMARYTGKVTVTSVWPSGCAVAMECREKEFPSPSV